MDAAVGFTQIFSSMVELFGVIYTSGYLLFAWLATPLSETAGENAEFLGDFLAYTPFELMFGPALIIVLIFALVKFINPF
jgi:hypothetical protein